jgi:DNA repair protein RecO (recombination protein O)
MRVNLQPAYVMHSRPYRDSSALLDVFTAEYGRINLVARGTRRQSRRGSGAALLQPFIPLLLSFSGRAELKTLVATEAVQGVFTLRKERMFSGLYMNELLVRLLHRNDAHPALFAAYDAALKSLAGPEPMDAVLRRFEFTLLDEMGYSFDLHTDGASGQPVQVSCWYRYDPGFGLVASGEGSGNAKAAFSGRDLLAVAAGDYTGPGRAVAKRLLREALAFHLGGTPLRSRELFRGAGLIQPGESAQEQLAGSDQQ